MIEPTKLANLVAVEDNLRSEIDALLVRSSSFETQLSKAQIDLSETRQRVTGGQELPVELAGKQGTIDALQIGLAEVNNLLTEKRGLLAENLQERATLEQVSRFIGLREKALELHAGRQSDFEIMSELLWAAALGIYSEGIELRNILREIDQAPDFVKSQIGSMGELRDWRLNGTKICDKSYFEECKGAVHVEAAFLHVGNLSERQREREVSAARIEREKSNPVRPVTFDLIPDRPTSSRVGPGELEARRLREHVEGEFHLSVHLEREAHKSKK